MIFVERSQNRLLNNINAEHLAAGVATRNAWQLKRSQTYK